MRQFLKLDNPQPQIHDSLYTTCMWIQVQKYWNDKSINSTLSKSKYLYHVYNHINISI